MYAKDFKCQAKTAMKGNWGTVIISMLVYSLVLGISSMIPLGSFILTGVLNVGMFGVMLMVIRNQAASVANVFDGFKSNLGANILAGILYTIYIALWSLLFCIPGIIKTYSYSMTFYILNDHPEMTANEAITESRRIMNGNKWRLFCLDFSFIGWMILSAFTFGILMIYVVPYMQAARAAFYESIKNN